MKEEYRAVFIRHKKSGKVYLYETDAWIKRGDAVLVYNAQGLEVGWAVTDSFAAGHSLDLVKEQLGARKKLAKVLTTMRPEALNYCLRRKAEKEKESIDKEDKNAKNEDRAVLSQEKIVKIITSADDSQTREELINLIFGTRV